MRTSLYLMLAGLWWLGGGALHAADYVVATNGNDQADGRSVPTAWRTIQHAVDAVIPGDTVTVRAGAYAGARIHATGTAEAPIILRAAPGEGVVLDAVSTAAWHNCILEVDNGPQSPVAYWSIEGFVVTNAPRYGIAVFGAAAAPQHHVAILSNRVWHSAVSGIFTAFADDMLIEGNESAFNGEHGIYCSNSGDRPTVIGNQLHHNVGCGVHMNGDASMGGDGIISGVSILANRIHDNGSGGGSGINLDGIDGGRVINNLIHNDHASGISLYDGDGAIATRGVDVLHNTVVLAEDGRWALNMPDAGSVSNRVYNNILYTAHSWRGSIAVFDPAPAGFVCDYNAVQDRFSVDGGDNRIDLSAWRALGYGAHSILAGPGDLFVDAAAGAFTLQADAPAVDAGLLLDGVSTDLDGRRRPFGAAPDIGALEWREDGLLIRVSRW